MSSLPSLHPFFASSESLSGDRDPGAMEGAFGSPSDDRRRMFRSTRTTQTHRPGPQSQLKNPQIVRVYF